MVYVISKDGKPLMPTKRHGKVRRLLKQGLAKADAHIRLVNFVAKILPVTKVVVEVAPFDIHKIVNPIGIIYGLRISGYFDMRSLSGEKIHSSVKWSNLKLLEKAKTLILERGEQRIPLHLKEDGVSCAGL